MLLTTHFHYSNRKVEFTFHESLSITPSLLLFSLLFMHPLDLPILELKISKIEFISTQSRFSKPDTQTTLEVLQNKTIFHFHFTFFSFHTPQLKWKTPQPAQWKTPCSKPRVFSRSSPSFDFFCSNSREARSGVPFSLPQYSFYSFSCLVGRH